MFSLCTKSDCVWIKLAKKTPKPNHPKKTQKLTKRKTVNSMVPEAGAPVVSYGILLHSLALDI